MCPTQRRSTAYLQTEPSPTDSTLVCPRGGVGFQQHSVRLQRYSYLPTFPISFVKPISFAPPYIDEEESPWNQPIHLLICCGRHYLGQRVTPIHYLITTDIRAVCRRKVSSVWLSPFWPLRVALQRIVFGVSNLL